jgi:hypothetical protein
MPRYLVCNVPFSGEGIHYIDPIYIPQTLNLNVEIVHTTWSTQVCSRRQPGPILVPLGTVRNGLFKVRKVGKAAKSSIPGCRFNDSVTWTVSALLRQTAAGGPHLHPFDVCLS